MLTCPLDTGRTASDLKDITKQYNPRGMKSFWFMSSRNEFARLRLWISLAVPAATWTIVEATIAATDGASPAMAAPMKITSKIGEAWRC